MASDRPKKKPAARSGEHPAVKAYREKLESINEKEAPALTELDRELEEFLNDLKTTPPPKAAT